MPTHTIVETITATDAAGRVLAVTVDATGGADGYAIVIATDTRRASVTAPALTDDLVDGVLAGWGLARGGRIRRGGRPPKAPGEALTVTRGIRFAPGEPERIDAAAEAAGETLSSLGRRLLLEHAAAHPPVEAPS